MSHVLTAISVFPARCEVGARLLLIILFSVLADVELLPHWVNRFFDDLSCVEAGKRELCASHNDLLFSPY